MPRHPLAGPLAAQAVARRGMPPSGAGLALRLPPREPGTKGPMRSARIRIRCRGVDGGDDRGRGCGAGARDAHRPSTRRAEDAEPELRFRYSGLRADLERLQPLGRASTGASTRARGPTVTLPRAGRPARTARRLHSSSTEGGEMARRQAGDCPRRQVHVRHYHPQEVPGLRGAQEREGDHGTRRPHGGSAPDRPRGRLRADARADLDLDGQDLPEASLGGAGRFRRGPLVNAPVGSGPFKFARWEKGQARRARGQHGLLPRRAEARPPCLSPDHRRQRRPRRVRRRAAAVPATTTTRRRSPRSRRCSATRSVKVVFTPSHFSRDIQLNLTRRRSTSSQVRQAIAHAIDRDAMNQLAFNGLWKPAIARQRREPGRVDQPQRQVPALTTKRRPRSCSTRPACRGAPAAGASMYPSPIRTSPTARR